MSSRNHVVITGTGRAGTSFLVELLTHLGLDTGFSVESLLLEKCSHSEAGLESDIRKEPCPYIVKSPQFCGYAREVVMKMDVSLDHVFIPIRDLFSAAESRRQVHSNRVDQLRDRVHQLPLIKRLGIKFGIDSVPGGLWHTRNSRLGRQENVLLTQVYNLLLALSETSTPVTFMQFPRIVTDATYLFNKLKPILGDQRI